MSENETLVEGAVADTENGVERRRRGGKPGPKQRFWACFAVKKDKPISEMIPWPTPETNEEGQVLKTLPPRSNGESEAAVRKEFKRRHRVDPLAVIGPIYEVKDKPAEKLRLGISVSTRVLLQNTNKSFSGVYKGWVVYGNGLPATEVDGHKYEANELIRPYIDTVADSASDPKPPRPRLKPNEALLLSDLENVQELSG